MRCTAQAAITSRIICSNTGWAVTQIRGDMNPGFGGIHPEPILPHLNALVDAVKESNGAFGLATDGDADRTGAVDEDGNFVSPHVIFALALRYLVEVRGLRGSVVKTVSTTRMIDRICKAARSDACTKRRWASITLRT